MKVIKMNTPDGQYILPLIEVAKNKAKHYVPSEENTSFEDEVNFVMEDDFEGIDWLLNNTNYEDWEDKTKKINSDVKVLHNDFWCSSDDFVIVDM